MPLTLTPDEMAQEVSLATGMMFHMNKGTEGSDFEEKNYAG